MRLVVVQGQKDATVSVTGCGFDSIRRNEISHIFIFFALVTKQSAKCLTYLENV